jgi:elongation factor Ts
MARLARVTASEKAKEDTHMAEITASAVKALRDRTNLPMMDCKKALAETDGDMEKAIRWLREKFRGATVKFADRETAEGRIGAFVDPAAQVGGIIEMRCETAPSANNDLFVALAQDLAKQVALKGAKTPEELLAQPFIGGGKSVTERIHDVFGAIRENMKPARMTQFKGLVGSYVHHDGSSGAMVLVEGTKAEPQILRDVSMHITATRPAYARREDVPAEIVQREMEIAKSQIAADPKNASKPANIIEKIAEGKMKTWYAENVLNEQPFVKDESKTVGALLQSAGLKLAKFVRYKVGELS